MLPLLPMNPGFPSIEIAAPSVLCTCRLQSYPRNQSWQGTLFETVSCYGKKHDDSADGAIAGYGRLVSLFSVYSRNVQVAPHWFHAEGPEALALGCREDHRGLGDQLLPASGRLNL